MEVENNHVYVVPPDADLGIKAGKLTLTPRRLSAGLHLPIDRFFEALARDRGGQALGVVLTGTGYDGTLGVRAIKSEGGLTFAQDATSEHRSMPESAIASGCVDFVLPPEGIARELIRLGERAAAAAPPGDDAAFQRVLAALSRASGIDFAHYKHSTLRRRVERRVLIKGLPGLRDYAERVERDPDEARALGDEVLIHVTSFFRDPEVFDAVKALVLPKLLEKRPPDSPLRVWVPGCSTGEEVYSLAMAITEFLEETRQAAVPLKLFGTDISASSIDTARAARYPVGIERDVSPERLARFFTRLEGAYQIRKDLRDLCVFALQDATRDPPFPSMDLVSCRNLMIYLGAPLQDRLLPVFHYALKEPGFLLLGSAESARSFPGFTELDAKSRIFARTSAAPRLLFDFSGHRPLEPTSEARHPARQPAQDVHREADRLILAEYAPPGVVVTDDLAIIQFRGKTGAYLEPTPGVASFDLLRMVREELRVPLRQALDQARARQTPVLISGIPLLFETGLRQVSLEVLPFRVASSPQQFFAVLFREPAEVAAQTTAQALPAPEALPAGPAGQELASTRDYLQTVIERLEASNEELKAANEEIVSANEELRSTNEELQMAKEELQATNEELGTVNDEMRVRNAEATRLNDNLTNVLSSVAIPIVLLGRDARVRQFTPAAAKVFHLIASDIGRPLSDIKPLLPAPELTRMIADALQRLGTVESTVRDDEGRWHQLTVRPYVTLDNRIDGTVVTAIDVDAATRAAQLLDEARRYAESVIDTVRECLVVLDGELRVRSANRAFLQMFDANRAPVEGRRLDELVLGQLNLTALRTQLAALGAQDRLEGVRVEVDLETTGRRVFLLNARRIEKSPLTLLALDDVTERERARLAAAQAEVGFRAMLTTAAAAILMSDSSGRIVFANQLAARVFGYTPAELLELGIEALVPERLRSGHARLRAQFIVAPSARAMAAGRELCGLRKDGSEFPLEIVLSSMPHDGDLLVVSFITDISARKEAEKKLLDHQTRLQQMAFDAALAEEKGRRRIAADLHDRIGQALALAQIKLSEARGRIADGPRDAVDEAVALLAQSINDTRTLIFDLSPPVLYDLGLKEALAWLAEDVEKRHGIRVEIADDGSDKPLDDATASLVFRSIRELLMNVFKHARSPNANVALKRAGDHLEVVVEDKGVGFDMSAAGASGSGFGLFSVREQISRLGGTVEVASAPEQGTLVRLRVPLLEGGPAQRGPEGAIP